MNKHKAILNIGASIIGRVITLVFLILSRRLLIQYIGDEAVGLYSLFLSVMGTLSIAESGMGVAIIFSMYKQISEKNYDEITSLYYLYKKIYLYIAVIILIIGLLFSPFIPYIATEYSGNINIYSSYILMVLATTVTYVFASEVSLFNAYKNNYIGSILTTIGQIIQSVLQIFVLINYKSFDLYILSILIGNVIQWVIASCIFNRSYKVTLTSNRIVSLATKVEIKKNIGAMISHKFGGTLVISINGIIISSIINVVALGTYSNYMTIMTAMSSILVLFFSSITSIIGHIYTLKEPIRFYELFKKIYLINFVAGLIFFIGYLVVIEDLLVILFNPGFFLDGNIIVVLTVSNFIQFMRQSALMFKDATGTFYNDRFKPIFEGLLNIFLSFIFGYLFGIVGIIFALIITNLLITHTIEPYVLFKHALNRNVKKYYAENYSLIIIFSISSYVLYKYIPNFSENIYLNLIFRGLVSILSSVIILSLIYISSKEFRKYTNEILKTIKHLIIKK